MPEWTAVDVADAFGLGQPLGEAVYVARGAMGQIWRVDTTTGAFAVKQLFEPVDSAALSDEVALIERAVASGVRAPRPVRAPKDDLVVTVSGVPIRVSSWLGFTEAPKTAEFASEAGYTLALLHNAGWDVEPVVDPWYINRHIGGPWEALADRAEQEGADWAPLLAASVSTLRVLDDLVTYPRDKHHKMCHRDFDRSNLGLSEDGVVVLDWDNAGPLVPELEVGTALVGFGSADPTLANAFAEGYERGGRTFPREPWIFASSIAARGNFIWLMAEGALDEAGARGEAWTEDVVTSLLSNPVTAERLEALLRAV